MPENLPHKTQGASMGRLSLEGWRAGGSKHLHPDVMTYLDPLLPPPEAGLSTTCRVPAWLVGSNPAMQSHQGKIIDEIAVETSHKLLSETSSTWRSA